eukprot:5636511-Pleurochrysis_carterae.AAC.1
MILQRCATSSRTARRANPVAARRGRTRRCRSRATARARSKAKSKAALAAAAAAATSTRKQRGTHDATWAAARTTAANALPNALVPQTRVVSTSARARVPLRAPLTTTTTSRAGWPTGCRVPLHREAA